MPHHTIAIQVSARAARCPLGLPLQTLLVVATLLGGAAAVAQPVIADQASDTATLIQRQAQQQQSLIQGQAATQLSHSQAKRLAASAPRPTVQPRQPVSEPAVQLNRLERIRRLNASKVPAVAP